MANSKDNLQKYGKGFIGFDESSGNALDSIEGWTGALIGNPIRVAGWNGIGNSMQFNGTNQYVEFNNNLIPYGNKVIRFKMFLNSVANQSIITNGAFTAQKGIGIFLINGKVRVDHTNGTSYEFSISSTKTLSVNMWYDIIVTFNFIDKFVEIGINKEYEKFTISGVEHTPYTGSTSLGVTKNGTTIVNYFNGRLDAIEIYNRIISPIADKYLVLHNSQYKYHNGTAWQATTATEANFKQYGMSQLSQITEAQWKELTGVKSLAMWTDFEDKKWVNAVLNVESYTPQQLLGVDSQVVYYTDSGVKDVTVRGNTEPFSVYDYIGELPEVIVHSETTDDISISTNVKPFSIYDKFEDEVEVLYYTNNADTTEANTIIDANWSPVDELEDTFDVVSWTDEVDASRALEMNAIPKPQFVYSVDIADIQNGINKILATDLSQSTEAKFLITPDNVTWYTWSLGNFVPVTLTEDNIIAEGMTAKLINNLTLEDLQAWTLKKLNIGVFLIDDTRKDTRAKVNNVGYSTAIYSSTSKISDVDFYILNTTATINIDLSGLTLTGQVNDADMTRVQYRTVLNGQPYFPSDGNFTPLSSPPLNIDLTIKSEDVKIGDWNKLRVEFQDSFGTLDFWEVDFIGRYAGIMFMDSTGEYYSTDVGKVLQYLDFGQILTGQITPSYEIKIKNEYGFDVYDTTVAVNTNNFAPGLTAQLSDSDTNFQTVKNINLGDLAIDQEKSFFIRMVSDVATVPNNNKEFDIVVMAKRKI